MDCQFARSLDAGQYRYECLACGRVLWLSREVDLHAECGAFAANADTPPQPLQPPEICRHAGSRLGTVDCGCGGTPGVYECRHSQQTHQPAICSQSIARPGPFRVTYDAGCDDQFTPVNCLLCPLREPPPPVAL